MALVLASSDQRYLDQYEEEEEYFHSELDRDIRAMNAKTGILAKAVERVRGFLRKYGKAILQHTVALAFITAVIVGVTKALNNAAVALSLQNATTKLASVLQVTGLAVSLYQLTNVVVKALTPDKYSSVGDRMHEMLRAHDDLKSGLRDINGRLIAAEKLRANKAGTMYNPDIAENHYEADRANLVAKLARLDPGSQAYKDGIDRLVQMELDDEARVKTTLDRVQREQEHEDHKLDVHVDLSHALNRRRAGGNNPSDHGLGDTDFKRKEYTDYKARMAERAAKYNSRSRDRYSDDEGAFGSALSAIAVTARVAVAGDQILNPASIYDAGLDTGSTALVAIPRFKDDARFMARLGRMNPTQVDRYAQQLAVAPNRAYDFVDRVREILRAMKSDNGVGAKVYRLGGFVVQWASIFAANAVIFKMLKLVTADARFEKLGVFTRTGLAIICVINTILVLLATSNPARLPEASSAMHKVQKLAVKTKELVHESVFTSTQSTNSHPVKV